MGGGESKSRQNKPRPPVDTSLPTEKLAELLCKRCPNENPHYATHECTGTFRAKCTNGVCEATPFFCAKHPEEGRICAWCRDWLKWHEYGEEECQKCAAENKEAAKKREEEQKEAQRKKDEENVAIANKNLGVPILVPIIQNGTPVPICHGDPSFVYLDP